MSRERGHFRAAAMPEHVHTPAFEREAVAGKLFH
jgi:hypothetical protein